MFYKPQSKETGLMWDTWLYWHEGTYFLFYLAKSKSDDQWDNMSLATSDNGVHWKEQGVILAKRPDAVWMGTGSTWASPNFERDGKFFINFSDNSFLNGQYTVYGRVIDGMQHVDAITRGEPPANPDRMISVKVAADA